MQGRRSMAGGFGLLALLVTVVIMGFLAVKVLSAVGPGPVDTVVGTPAPSLGPEAAVDPPGAGGEIQGGAGSGTAEVTATSCAAARATIDTAAQLFVAMNPSPPTSVQDLVDSGLLDSPVGEFTLTADGATYTLVGVGECDGF